jgi:hypothetical protein
LHLYTKPYHIDINQLKQDIDKVYNLVKPNHFNVLGGETFLYPDLIDLLLYIQEFPVEDIYVYTNGTIDLDLSLLKNKLHSKVKFYIQNYPKSIAKDQIVAQCKLYHFNYEVLTYPWTNYGDLEWCDNGIDRFRLCKRKCWTLLNSKLYLCPRAAHADNLKKIPLTSNHYVDLRKDDVVEQYKNFCNMEELPTCNYCFIGSNKDKEISRGT